MPQSTLLSYFSKPVTNAASSSIQPAKKESDASMSNSFHQRDVTAESTPINTTSIQSALLRRESQKRRVKTKDFQGLDALPCDDSKAKSNPLRSIQIPHLTKALISPVLEEHLPSIRRLTATTLPVRYSDAFFMAAVTDPVVHQISRVVVYDSEPVGWIRCRLEPCAPANSRASAKQKPSSPSQLYIQALAILSPYRNLGLATLLLREVLASAASLDDRPVCVYAHVWEKNEDALEWYAKRGFKRILLVERYYPRLRPGGAWIARMDLDDL